MRGRGENANIPSFRHLQGKHAKFVDPAKTLQAMVSSTEVIISQDYIREKPSLLVRMDPAHLHHALYNPPQIPYTRKYAVLRDMHTLMKLKNVSANDMEAQFAKTPPPHPNELAKTFGFPSGIDSVFWSTYWQCLAEKVNPAVARYTQENTESALTGGVRHQKWRYEKGKLLLVRLGEMSQQKQVHRTGNVAPETRGAWAFVWPHFDIFFAGHKINSLMPKNLKEDARPDWKTAPDEQIEAWGNDRDAWLAKNKLRPKTFWYSGDIYTRFDKQGEVHWGEWSKMNTQELYNLQYKVAPPKRSTADHLEVFIPGKERGRTN